MAELGRRKHVRFPLAQPIDGSLLVREEVAIEEWNDQHMVVLSPEPCPVGERVTLEIPDDKRRSMNGKVAECRPAVVGDGEIRHRIKLSIEDKP
ncbi:MAG: hypothetical protein NTV05_07475 [Acidobacteria bacterium]|nr:hypothetical protein [Acidobacteriota bacterium]